MLISPSEPPEFKALGVSSSVPEKYGADFLIPSPLFGRVGVQRKEVNDLVASMHGDRMERQIWQQRDLGQAIWLIEGRMEWTVDGQLLSSATRQKYTRSMHLGVILSLQSYGYWILNSTSIADSIVLLSSLNKWLMKVKHTSLLRRPAMKSQVAGDMTDQQIHIMQGFPRVGYEKAKAIVEMCKGLPFQMRDGVDLTDVAGIGLGTAEGIERLVNTAPASFGGVQG
jgi:ERCC4-type nuclease